MKEPIYNFSIGFSGVFLIITEIDGRISILNLEKGEEVNSFYIQNPGRKKVVALEK